MRDTIRRGQKSEDVGVWQTILGTRVDWSFGNKTHQATLVWQEEHGLEPDGVVGPKTWEAAIRLLENVVAYVKGEKIDGHS